MRAPGFSARNHSLPEHHFALPVREGGFRLPLQPGITLAPPGYHLLVSDTQTLDISQDERVNWSCPSIDVLFRSAAEVFGSRLITLTLTNVNADADADGAEGAAYTARLGVCVLAQNPADAEHRITLRLIALAGVTAL
ncbi:MAG: two-component system chemotaxis response regulator CheB [Motiliproteus sp.]|jgi:two-component system chemotaxis response regulator CheB